jgi:hypothetical protein
LPRKWWGLFVRDEVRILPAGWAISGVESVAADELALIYCAAVKRTRKRGRFDVQPGAEPRDLPPGRHGGRVIGGVGVLTGSCEAVKRVVGGTLSSGRGGALPGGVDGSGRVVL